MNIELKKILDSKIIEKERITFKTLVDDNIGFYGVFKTKKAGEKTFSSRVQETFWFPDRQIKKDDLIVLYSKSGISSEKKNTDGTSTHFFYWGKDNPLWLDDDDSVVLFKFDDWKAKLIRDNT